MPTTSFANPGANDGVVEADGYSGPLSTGVRFPNGMNSIALGNGITVFHSGDAAPPTATTGTDTTPVVTQTYLVRIDVRQNASLTGLALLNGSAVAGNVIGALYNAAGAVVATTASTVQAGIAGYQQIPFTAPYIARGPAIYFAAFQFNNTGARFRTHTLGNFTGSTQTGQVFGTFTAYTSPNTFTTGVAPICDSY